MLGGDHKYEELFPLHVHATWQAQAGWLGEDQVIEARATGSYRITTLESLDSGPKTIRVPLGRDHLGEPAYYWLQTREFSPWTPAHWRSIEDLSPCQVDVRLEATGVFDSDGYPRSTKNTYFFDGNGIELTVGQRREVHGESIVRPQTPFHDPYRGIRMEIADCVEGEDGRAIEVLIETTTLTAAPSIVAHLYDEQRSRRTNCPWVFASPCGGPVTVDREWNAIRAAAGLPTLRIHDRRHSHAAVAVNGGEGLRAVAGLLGHADIKTTFGYAHLAEDSVFDAAGIVADARLHDPRHAHASQVVMNGESLHVAGRLLGHRRASTTNRYVHLDDATLSQAAERVASAVQQKLLGTRLL